MAKKIFVNHMEEVRSRIKVSNILARLQKVADGEVKADSTQIKAAEILLRKAIPDLSSIELTGDKENPVHFSMSMTDAEIIKRYNQQKDEKK